MTKRMLSLLLALVMTLSLCVPALAADEFAAEAVTDVEEQAPVAPEAPVEPEAEEPAEEPVVDEPAVEEPAVEDAPELASILPEDAEDLPLLVALGKITKEAHWNLYNEVAKADAVAEKIAAGGVRLAGYNAVPTIYDEDSGVGVDLEKYAEDPEANDPFQNELVWINDDSEKVTFEEALAHAQEMLDAINGAATDEDVTDTTVNAAKEQLAKFTGTGALSAEPDADEQTLDSLEALLAKKYALATYEDEAAPFGGFDDFAFNGTDKVTKDGDFAWTKAYSAKYLEALQKAIDAVAAYSAKDTAGTATYADYKDVVYTILDTLVLEAEAGKPEDALATRATTALAEGKAIDPAKPADTAKYLFNYDEVIAEAIAGVDPAENKGVLEGTVGAVMFKPNTTRYAAVTAIEALEKALTKQPAKTSVKIENFAWTNGNEYATVDITVEKYDDDPANTVLDGFQYKIAWEVTHGKETLWFNGINNAGVKGAAPEENGIGELKDSAEGGVLEAEWKTNDNYPGKWYGQVEVYNVGGDTFAAGDSVTIHIYKAVDGIATGESVVTKTYKIKASPAAVVKPKAEIEKVYYVLDDVQVGVFADGDKLIDDNGTTSPYNSPWLTDSAVYEIHVDTKAAITIAGTAAENGSLRAVATIGSKQIPSILIDAPETLINFVIPLTEEQDAALKAGKVGTVQIQWSKATGDQAAFEGNEIATADIVIPSITTWASVKPLKYVVAAANALIASDYELSENGKLHVGNAGKDAAYVVSEIKSRANQINAIITNASLGDTTTNRNKVGAILYEMVINWCSYLKPAKADITPLQLILKEARDLIGDPTDPDIKKDEGAGKYTFDSVGRLNDLVATGSGKYAKAPYDSASTLLKSQIDAAVAAIRAAINGLVPLSEVDRSALESAIEAAEALEAEKDNYTEESWKALEDALAAAKNMLARENATQTQLTNAAEFLNKAVNGLEKTEEIKKAEAEAALEEALAAAEEKLADADLYTEESVKALQDAVDAAEALPEDATSKNIQDAIDAIKDAIAALEEKPVEPEVDKTELEGTIAEAEAKVEADYTAESWAAMAEALEAAKTVAADEAATQEDVDAAAKALADAMDALVEAGDEPVEPADKSELIAGIAVITALSEYKDEFTAESWAAVEAALEAAEAVLDDEDATQEEVDAAVEAMVAALEALEEVPAVIPPAPSSGTGWVENEDGDIYFYQKGEVKKSFWVGKADGASKWDGNWYYVGADGKLVTGMAYLDDLHGGYGWYFLQPTNKNGEIGKMLTGWQWVGDIYGTCYFSSKAGESGKCTYSTELGDWTGTTWAK